MTTRRAIALAFLVGVATLTLTSASTARPPSPPATLDPADFQALVLPEPSGTPLPSFDLGRPASPIPIGDFQEEDRSFEPRVEPDQPTRAESILKPTPKPKPKPEPRAPAVTTTSGSSNSRTGTATWYCKAGVSVCHYQYPGGLYAAAGPALRVGDWRGRSVRVCASSGCVQVKLIDWCACPGSRIIDLYSDAFQRLAPLSAGTISVKVTW